MFISFKNEAYLRQVADSKSGQSKLLLLEILVYAKKALIYMDFKASDLSRFF
jgi:hypothetical protein